MIPQGSLDMQDGQETQQPGRTYRLDPITGTITGMIDGLRAVRQTVFKILQTERFEHEIYDDEFGAELQAQIGSTAIRSDLSRRIRNALLQDDRILEVTVDEIEAAGDEATISFTVVTVYGSFTASQEGEGNRVRGSNA